MEVAVYAGVWATIGSCFLVLLFVRAILHKWSGYAEFVGNVRDYRVLPEAAVPAAAAALLAAEVLAAAGLLLPPTRMWAALLAAALLLMYAGAIALNLARGRNSIDCGCGGGGQGISSWHVLRNLVLVLFAVPVVAWQGRPLSGVGPFVVALGCVAVLWLTFVVFDQLLGNRTHASTTTYSRL
ncbi:MAG TPA: MauE/DoxX family redox-associated membrane protein [Polyangiaceae bacterium]